jgi:hypothetical protein
MLGLKTPMLLGDEKLLISPIAPDCSPRLLAKMLEPTYMMPNAIKELLDEDNAHEHTPRSETH